jgi:hypothetical protein
MSVYRVSTQGTRLTARRAPSATRCGIGLGGTDGMGHGPAVVANSMSSGDRNCKPISRGNVDSTAPVAASMCACMAGSLRGKKKVSVGYL